MNYKDTVTWKEINETTEIFSKIYEKNLSVMSELVRAIKDSKAKNFIAAARGSSNNAVIYFKYFLEIMSKYSVGLSAPSIVTLYRGKIDYSNNIILGCSSSGLAEDVIEVVKKGNEQGAITIAVTNDLNSPLAKEAKFVLDCCAGEEKSFVATKTFNAELFLFAWLGSELSNNKKNIKILQRLKFDIEHVIPQIDALTNIYAEMFKKIESGFILSRGLTYPIALEASLEIQEICHSQVKGYANSEFYHGPLAMVNPSTPIIIYCAKYDGEEDIQSIIRADQMQCIQKMLSLKAPVLLITNDCVLTGKFNRCNDALINFSAPEEFTIFAFALFGQMMSLKIGCLKGLNPDEPYNIQKTTITK